jgi:hypothetical protein
MYFSPRLAFREDAYLIFLRDSRAESFFTGIIASKGQISARMASFTSPFHELIRRRLSFLKL